MTAMSEVGHRIPKVGIGGYPDTHPFIDRERLMEVLLQKQSMFGKTSQELVDIHHGTALPESYLAFAIGVVVRWDRAPHPFSTT